MTKKDGNIVRGIIGGCKIDLLILIKIGNSNFFGPIPNFINSGFFVSPLSIIQINRDTPNVS
jgi:hypothetical protein